MRPALLATLDTQPQQTPAITRKPATCREIPPAHYYTRLQLQEQAACRTNRNRKCFFSASTAATQQGCATPLPRCIPPRALSLYHACDRTLFQRPSYRSRSTPLSLQFDLFARTVGVALSHFVRAVERVLSNSKRVELTPVRLENGFSAITDYTLLLRPPLAHAHAHEHTTRRLPHLNLHSRGEPKP
jgi:hypothetical protein